MVKTASPTELAANYLCCNVLSKSVPLRNEGEHYRHLVDYQPLARHGSEKAILHRHKKSPATLRLPDLLPLGDLNPGPPD